MKIKAEEMFHTPEDWDELMNWIERHNRDDRAHLVTAAIMAWNLAAKITNPPEPTTIEQTDRIRFWATDDFNIGFPRSSCPFVKGPIRDIWLDQWDKGHEDQKRREPIHTEPANRQTITPFPTRNNRSSPND